MKKLAIFALASLAIFALASSAFAQPENGDFGVFFDLGTLSTSRTIGGFATFPVYMAGYNLGPISGWESKFTLNSAAWTNLGPTLTPASALNVGQPGNFIVGLGACVENQGAHLVCTYTLGYFAAPTAPNDLVICVSEGSSPSSFGGAPGYSTCLDVLKPFGLAENGGTSYPDGCGVVNPLSAPPVGTEEMSFGAVKASY